ncbi:MAG: hypothetical protein IJS52_10525 [Bacilli bacterium]|nr:hypothetical protein [Bacilli bacterium]
MQFEQALKHLKNGGTVRRGNVEYRLVRKGKENNVYLQTDHSLRADGKPTLRSSLFLKEILADDWELGKER